MKCSICPPTSQLEEEMLYFVQQLSPVPLPQPTGIAIIATIHRSRDRSGGRKFGTGGAVVAGGPILTTAGTCNPMIWSNAATNPGKPKNVCEDTANALCPAYPTLGEVIGVTEGILELEER